MLDNQGRILIPKDFKVLEEVNEGKVYFYYSRKEKLFYISVKEIESEYFVAKRSIDERGRVYLPKKIIEIYKSTDVLCTKKRDKVYLLPIKED